MKTNENNNSGAFGSAYRSVLRIAGLYLDNARLVTAQKLTVLFSSVAFYSLLSCMGIMAMLFVSIALGNLLSEVMDPFWAYMIVAGIYGVIIAVLVSMRKRLFIDPIARFMSRLLLDPPAESDKSQTSNDDQDEG